jgi:HSP20 family protein
LACSSPAGITYDSAIFLPSRIVNRIRRNITTARKSLEEIVNKPAVQRQSRPLLPELSELFNGFSGFPALTNLPVFPNLRPLFDSHLLRLEHQTKDGVYEVRAEVPGVDPDDIEVTVRDGQLTIKTERAQTSESTGHSEFSYGSFVRTVSLPAGADEDDINATYDRGILTVSVPLTEDQPIEKRVEVIETIPVDEDDDFDDDDDEHDQPQLEQAEHTENEDQHQPVG